MQSSICRLDADNIAILIADGHSTRDEYDTLPAAQALKDAGVKLFAIGVTNSINETVLQMISSPPQEKGVTYWHIADFQTLNSYELIDNMMTQVCAGTELAKAAAYGEFIAIGICHDEGNRHLT